MKIPKFDEEPLYTGMLQIPVCVNVNRHLLPRKTPFRGVSILRNKKSCLKLKNEIEKLHGLVGKIAALRTALIKHNRR